MHQLANQLLECIKHFSSLYAAAYRSDRLEKINIRTEAESVCENLINHEDVVFGVDAELREEEKCDALTR